MKKKIIIHVLNSKIYAGAENVVISIIKKMEKTSQYKMIYVSLNGPISEILEENNISSVLLDKLSPRKIKKIINEYKPYAIHAHDFTASIICAIATKKIPIISHLHNNRPWIRRRNLKSYLYYITSVRYKKILGVSNSVFDEYVFGERIKHKSKVVGNPIDISAVRKKAINGIDKYKTYDIATLGRLSIAKNPIRFIKLVHKLKMYNPDIRAVMIGDGELQGECKNLIKELDLERNIDMIGFLKNPYPILKNVKVLCMASNWEGYGLAAIEALSLGVPVLATPVGGLKEIVTEKCGSLCVEDEEFINKIMLLITNNEIRERKSKNAKIRSDEFDNIVKYIEELNTIYESVL